MCPSRLSYKCFLNKCTTSSLYYHCFVSDIAMWTIFTSKHVSIRIMSFNIVLKWSSGGYWDLSIGWIIDGTEWIPLAWIGRCCQNCEVSTSAMKFLHKQNTLYFITIYKFCFAWHMHVGGVQEKCLPRPNLTPILILTTYLQCSYIGRQLSISLVPRLLEREGERAWYMLGAHASDRHGNLSAEP